METKKEITNFIKIERIDGKGDAEIYKSLREKVSENLYSDYQLIKFINLQPSNKIKDEFKKYCLLLSSLYLLIGIFRVLAHYHYAGELTPLIVGLSFFMPGLLAFFVSKLNSKALIFSSLLTLSQAKGLEFSDFYSITIAGLVFCVLALSVFIMKNAFPGLIFTKKLKVPGEDRFVS